MNKVVIYRVDGVMKKDVPVGTVEERRKRERGDNLIGLIRVARKEFASLSGGSMCIKSGGARVAF